MEQHGGGIKAVGEALGTLRRAWGDAYDITRTPGGQYDAVSRDAEARVFSGDFPGELEARLRADRAREGAP